MTKLTFWNFAKHPSSQAKSSTSEKARKWSQILILTPLYLLQLCYGMNSGFPAILTPQLKENCDDFTITATQEAWIVSMENTVTPWVCLISGFLQLKFGPKKVLMMTCFPYIMAWVMSHFANSVWMIFCSRALVGCSNALVTTTVYTIEIASTDLRGTCSLLEAVQRCLGTLLVYSMGYLLRWHQIALISIVPPLLSLLLLFFVPESPTHLIKNGHLLEAEAAIKKCFGAKYNTQIEMSKIQQGLQAKRALDSGKKQEPMTRMFRRPEVYKPFLIVMYLSFIQQFSGMSILRSYVVKIFDDVFQDQSSNNTQFRLPHHEECKHQVTGEAYLAAILIGLMRLLSSLLLSKLLYHIARRPMYFWSAGLTIMSLFSFATFRLFLFNQVGDPRTATIFKWSSLVSACTLVFGVQLGVQTLPLLLSGELFPSDVRAACKSIARSCQCILLVTCLMLFPVLEHSALQTHGAFYLFGALIFLALPIVYLVVPETKDVSLERIQSFFTSNKSVCQTISKN